MVSTEGQTEAVLELYRRDKQFSEDDVQVAASYLAWASLALYYANLYHKVCRQKGVTDFLLSVVQLVQALFICKIS